MDVFLQKWFADHPITSMLMADTALPDAESPPPAETRPASPLAMPALLTLTAQGDDRCLAKNGWERDYWYSIPDLQLLMAEVRKQRLNYVRPDDSKREYESPGGERLSTYRQNQPGIFIADPYTQVGDCPFGKFLAEDIAVITKGTHLNRSHRERWDRMLRQLFFSLWYHSHWQLIGLEIDYTRAHYQVIWDDPFGKERFSESFYAELFLSLQTAVRTLFTTHRALTPSSIDKESKLELKSTLTIKSLDQQGHGVNGYDCGPIVVQNLQDYVTHAGKNKSLVDFDEKHYTIPAAGVSDWEKTLIEVCAAHFKHAKQVVTGATTLYAGPARLTTQQTALTKTQQAQQAQLTDEKTAVPRELAAQISALPAAQLGVLFATIDHQRLLDKKSLHAPYTPEELQTGYALITKSQKDKPAEPSKTLSLLFPPSPKSSSPSPATQSALSSSTLTSAQAAL